MCVRAWWIIFITIIIYVFFFFGGGASILTILLFIYVHREILIMYSTEVAHQSFRNQKDINPHPQRPLFSVLVLGCVNVLAVHGGTEGTETRPWPNRTQMSSKRQLQATGPGC